MESAAKPATASTLFDSHTQPQFAGIRGNTDARHLVLRAEGFDIHVKIAGTAPSRQMDGQILARGAPVPVDGARLHLLRDGERLATTVADKLGEFQFHDVPEGLLSLQVDLPNLTVVGALSLDS
jgi:hypothetical protein